MTIVVEVTRHCEAPMSQAWSSGVSIKRGGGLPRIEIFRALKLSSL